MGEMGHLRRLGGRWSALGGAWPDPKGPGRCLPTPWVPWVRAVPIGPLRWPGGRSRAPESAVLPSGAVVGTHPVRPCTCTMRPTQVPELPVAGPHAPRGPTRSLGWARGGCFGLEGACGACFRSTRQIPLFSRIRGPHTTQPAASIGWGVGGGVGGAPGKQAAGRIGGQERGMQDPGTRGGTDKEGGMLPVVQWRHQAASGSISQ